MTYDSLFEGLEEFIFTKLLDMEHQLTNDEIELLKKIANINIDALEQQTKDWENTLSSRKNIRSVKLKTDNWQITNQEKDKLINEAQSAYKYFNLLKRFKKFYFPNS